MMLSIHSAQSINSRFWLKVFTLCCGIQARISKRTKTEMSSSLWLVSSFLLLIQRPNSTVTKLKELKKCLFFAKPLMSTGQRKSNSFTRKTTKSLLRRSKTSTGKQPYSTMKTNKDCWFSKAT